MAKRFLTLFFIFLWSLGFGAVLTVSNLNNSGPGSLRSIINTAGAGDIIRFSNTLLNSGNDTLFLDSQIVISQPITIKGVTTLNDSIWISGKGASRIFQIEITTNPSKVIFDSLNFCNTNTTIYGPLERNGGAIKVYDGDQIALNNCYFKNNASAALGGAVYGDSCNVLTISNSEFYKNKALSGGAILLRGEVFLDVKNSKFYQNNTTSITGGGGAIATDTHAEFLNVEFFENSTGNFGGAVYIKNTQYLNKELIFRNCDFIGNTVNAFGGAISVICDFRADSLDLNLSNCKFIENYAGVEGGAVVAKLIESNSKQTKFINIQIDSSVFKLNEAPKGGAIFTYCDSIKNTFMDFELANSIIDSNKSFQPSTGAIDLKLALTSINSNLVNELKLNILQSEIINNYSTTSSSICSGILAWASKVYGNISNSTFRNNDLGNFYSGNFGLNLSVDSTNIEGNRGFGFSLNSKVKRKIDVNHCNFNNNQNACFNLLGDFFGSPDVIDTCTVFSSNFTGNQGPEGAVIQFLKPKNIILNVVQSKFSNNSVTGSGGAIFIDGPERLDLNINKHSKFFNNSAVGDGGAIYIEADSINFNLKTVALDSNNANNGGALYFRSTFDTSHVKIDSSSISFNNAAAEGGAIYSYCRFNKFKFSNLQCNYNSSIRGGAIRFFENQSTPGGELKIFNSNIFGNNSANEGGFAYLGNKQKAIITNSQLDSNTAIGNGGVFFARWVSFENCYVSNSLAGSGGVFYSPSGFFSAVNTTIEANKASVAAGGVAQADSVYLKNCWIQHNEGVNYGGAFFFNKGEINGSTFNNNLCFGRGGALSLTSNCKLLVKTSTFYQNEAHTFGGAICIRDFGSSPPFSSPTASCFIKNSTFYDNISPNQGSNFHFFSGSGSGIFTVDFEGNIFASNQSNHILASPVNINSIGFNIYSGMLNGTKPNDFVNISPVQLNFDSLKLNGGLAPTILPGKYSVAINNGNPNDTSNAQNSPIYLVREIGAAETSFCNKDSKISVKECDSLILPSFQKTITTSGTYYDTLSTVLGCDSTITYLVNIFNSGFQNDSVSSCLPNYTWSFNSTNYSSKGVYYDTLVGFNGCKVYSQLKLDFVSIDTSVSVTKFGVDSILLSSNELGGDKYQWYDCSNGQIVLSFETNSKLITEKNGNYLVEIEKSGCIANSNCINVSGLSIKNESDFEILTYPNPVQNNLNIIGLSTSQKPKIILVDVLGNELKSYNASTNTLSLNLSNLASGVYFLRILNKKEAIFNQKVIKE